MSNQTAEYSAGSVLSFSISWVPLFVPVLIEKEDGMFLASTPLLGGIYDAGKTIEECLSEFKEGWECVMEAYYQEGLPLKWNLDKPEPVPSDAQIVILELGYWAISDKEY